MPASDRPPGPIEKVAGTRTLVAGGTGLRPPEGEAPPVGAVDVPPEGAVDVPLVLAPTDAELMAVLVAVEEVGEAAGELDEAVAGSGRARVRRAAASGEQQNCRQPGNNPWLTRSRLAA